MRLRLRHLAAVLLIACSLAGPLAAVVQQQACRKMGMHHDGRTPCWCGEMSGFGASLSIVPALPGTPPTPFHPAPPAVVPAFRSVPPLPDSPAFPPTPPPPNELPA